MDFAGGHVFSYSARPGTAAARLPDQVQPPVRKNRNHIVRDILKSSAAAYQVRFIGKELTVLWESLTALDDTGWQLSGLSDNCLRITALAPQALWNTLTPVRLTGHNQAGLHGLILE
jgi:threonylcarbamoyladenosine tRNA methylthiotransferase MtaB